jgi:hypothetical protein
LFCGAKESFRKHEVVRPVACVAGEKLPWRSIVYCHSTAIVIAELFRTVLSAFYINFIINF